MGKVYKVLNNRKINNSPYYFAARLILEKCENVHLHYRNLRLEFSNDEFCDMFRCFKEGFKVFQKYILDSAEIKNIELSKIDPFDAGHKEKDLTFDCGKEQEQHKQGIKYIKEQLTKGKKIRPIVVIWVDSIKKYKRMDGFKRYWAYKELGLNTIKCYILKEYIAGIQEDLSAFI